MAHRTAATRPAPAAPPDADTPVGDPRLVALLAWSAIALTLAEFLAIPSRFRTLFPGTAAAFAAAGAPGWTALAPFAWWQLLNVPLWVLVPLWLARRAGASAFSLRPPGTLRDWAPYLALAALMVPLVAVASRLPGFLHTYPLLRPTSTSGWSWAVLLAFWALYATNLWTVECFFRGSLLFALEPRLGATAIGVTVLPYCLIHVHKPLPEALGSIVAGFVLGALALRTRRIGGGVFVHVAVALSMDVIALAATHAFPTRFWP
jgi:hypothetical protein